MASLLLAIIYLSFISLGPARLAAGVGLACDAFGVWSIPLLCRGGLHDYLGRHHCIQSALRPNDAAPGGGAGDGGERCHDSSGAVRIFHLPGSLDALPVGNSLWARRGRRRRGAEQLRCPPLFGAPYELVARLLGCGRVNQSLHHERLSGSRQQLARAAIARYR